MSRILKEVSLAEFQKKLESLEGLNIFFEMEGNIAIVHITSEKKEHFFGYISRFFEQKTEET